MPYASISVSDVSRKNLSTNILSITLFVLLFISACGARGETWRNAQQVIDMANTAGSHLGVSTSKIHNPNGNPIILDSVDIYTETTLGIDPAGFIIIFQEDKQAELFLHAGTFYNDDPDTSKKYRFIRNRNAVLFINQQIPENETSKIFSDFQGIEP